MAISFSGLASGMDTSSWVEALVSVKQAEITKLETKKATIAETQSVLSNVKSYFSSFQGLLENITDAKMFNNSTRDLFAQNLAESSNATILTAVASTAAENTTYNIEVQKLATNTEVKSGIKETVTTSNTSYATLDSKLFSLLDNAEDPQEIVAGKIKFSVDNHEREIEIDENSTIGSFIDSLNSIGIAASYNSSTGVFSINIDSRESATGTTKLVSDETHVIDALHLQDVNQGYKTDAINIITVNKDEGAVKLNTKLKDMGITDAGDLSFDIIKDDGTTESSSFTQENTLAEVFDRLKNDYNIDAQVSNDGVITLTSGTHGNVFSGGLATALGFDTIESPFVSLSKMTSTAVVYSTQETLINRDATLSQIGAYQNAGDNIVIRKQDGGEEVATISSLNGDSTVQDFFDALTPYGITATITDGVITLSSTGGNYIDGNIATNIGILHPVTDTYTTTAPVTMTSSATIDTTKSLGALGMSSDASVVIYSPVYGVVSVNIAKELSVQGFCDKINDSNYGIHAEIVDDKVQISELAGSGSYVKGMSSVLQNALKLTVGESQSYETTTHEVYSNTNSSYIKYNDTGVEIDDNTVIGSINGYQHGNGEILLHNNGVISTIMVDSTLTLEEFINNPIVGLAQYGITGDVLSDGKAYLTSDNDIYLEEKTGGSQILTALKLSGLTQVKSGQHILESDSLGYSIVETNSAVAKGSDKLNSTICVNGTTTTVDATGTLVFTVNGYYKTISLNENDTYNSLINKLGDAGIEAYLTSGSFYIASGYDNVTLLSDESSSSFASNIALDGPKDLGGYSVSSSPVLSKVENTYEEVLSASNYADRNTKLSSLNITSGRLTIYKDGQRKYIDINENTTFSNLQTKLSEQFSDLTIDFDEDGFLRDGHLTIKSSDPNANISLGSTSDTTNFVAITGIAKNEDNELESSRQLYKINDRTSLNETGLFRALGNSGKVQAGSFKVGDADIYINEDSNGKITTTIADIVAQINASEKSLATAYWDNIDGKLVIKSTKTGASAVNIEAGDTNFTELLGLTNGSNLVMDTQTIGSNAVFTINGARYTSLSNTVTSDSTGISGLTINLKNVSSGSAVQLTVKRDTETLKNAVKNVIDGYNELISNIDAAIDKSTGKLAKQTTLKLLRNNIRTAMNSSDAGASVFRNLAAIGIKTSATNANSISTSNQDIEFLSLDEEAFEKALEGDADAVKALLIGSTDSSGNVINKGILTRVEELVEGALTAFGGFFASASDTYEKQMEDVNKKIVKGTLAIEKYRKHLENKFSSMDTMIAEMQNQFSSFLS